MNAKTESQAEFQANVAHLKRAKSAPTSQPPEAQPSEAESVQQMDWEHRDWTHHPGRSAIGDS